MTAWTQTFHAVTESGTVNSMTAVPSGPVRRLGRQKAVSEKSLRRTAAGWGSGGAVAGATAASA